jgi:hypothetical protein
MMRSPDRCREPGEASALSSPLLFARLLMTTPTEIRMCLAQNDFVPIPVNGKAAVLEGWQKRTTTSQSDLDAWARMFPGARNTGLVCDYCPTLDLDLLDAATVDAAVAMVRARFEGRGKVLVRHGQRPKCAIPFRCDAPFAKIQVPLIAPDGAVGEKLEFLCRGQQIVVDGEHPGTHAPYEWLDDSPANTRRDELPLVDEAEAQALMNDLTALVLSRGYQRVGGSKNGANGKDDDTPGAAPGDTNGASDAWGDLFANVLAGADLHDSQRSLGARLVHAGMHAGAVINTLQGLMKVSKAPRDKRWKERYREIPKLVESAVRLARKKARQAQDTPIPETDGARVIGDAFAYQKRFVCYPSTHAAVAHTLWIAHTYMLGAWESTPRLAFLSAEPTSGKTRSLEISEPMVPNAVSTVNASAA